jgi:hypothetical protein
MSVETPDRFSLRRLPLPARLVLSAFLLSVGIGYVSALVQLHFKHAKPGEMLPTPKDAERLYHGEIRQPQKKENGAVKAPPAVPSKIEQLIDADEKGKFQGTGQMRTAFTIESKDWENALRSVRPAGGPEQAPDHARVSRQRKREASSEDTQALHQALHHLSQDYECQ